jgi:hypothetical protein
MEMQKKTVTNELIDSLLADYKKPESRTSAGPRLISPA